MFVEFLNNSANINIFMETNIFKSRIGWIKIKTTNGCIHSLKFVNKQVSQIHNQELLEDVNDFLSGESSILTSKFHLSGTAFQKKVWKAICKIPCGQTKTYGEIAKAIGHPTAYRAVANACGQNKIALYVPCHRVTAKNDLGGYKWGINKKKWLQKFERSATRMLLK